MSYWLDMSERLYTLKEMAERLNHSGGAADLQRITRQIRHWTLSDLLRTEGKKHTGTGVSRRYSFFELQKAAVLRELSHYGIQIAQLSEFDRWVERMAHAPLWREAEAGNRIVFLQLCWNDQTVACLVTADLPAIADPALYGGGTAGEPDASRPQFYSSVVVNLTRLLHRLGQP